MAGDEIHRGTVTAATVVAEHGDPNPAATDSPKPRESPKVVAESGAKHLI
jgi:hypothetical protein